MPKEAGGSVLGTTSSAYHHLLEDEDDKTSAVLQIVREWLSGIYTPSPEDLGGKLREVSGSRGPVILISQARMVLGVQSLVFAYIFHHEDSQRVTHAHFCYIPIHLIRRLHHKSLQQSSAGVTS
jgi:hypothetical protein